MITALEAKAKVEEIIKENKEDILDLLEDLIMEEINSDEPLMFINVYDSKYATVRSELEDLGYKVVITNDRNEYMIMIGWE